MSYLFSFSFFIFYSFLLYCFLFSFYVGGFMLDYHLFDLFGLDFSFLMVFDFLSLGFFSCVSFISGVVFFYSMFYMEGTVDTRRFSWLVFLFVISMFILVFSGNFILTMVGWDGLGLVSFCLVIFYSNSFSLESGLITVFSNRVGDVFFLLSFFFFFVGGTFSWEIFSGWTGLLFLVFIFFGAITKSAQVPFSAWLPAAMAAPTPVSSLVHSSTLVTAGVYVLIRYNYVFCFFYMNYMKFFFVFTMVLAGVCATLESDLKKIVAMSTLSQLGMMMFILSSGAWVLSFIHMVVHAFFKSMLFLSTGSLMGQMSGTQDSRFYGAFCMNYSSFIYFMVSCLCLAGFPFFIGFYAKDFIISSCSYSEGKLFYGMFLFGCFFTVVYSTRLIHSAYGTGYSFSSYGLIIEKLSFFYPVSFLFLKCWLVGGMIYWMFLSSLSFYFTYFDLFTGIFVFVGGVSSFFVLRFFYSFLFSLSMILFLRWKTSSGVSFLFKSMPFVKYEGSWMEVSGGQGVYLTLYRINNFFSIFYKFSAASLFFILFLWVSYFL